MEKILVLDNYDSFTYNLVHYIESIPGYEVDVYRNDQIELNQVNQYNTIVLSPGPGLPKDAGLLNEIIRTYSPSKKILGVCLGMQAIAEVFGGELENLEQVYHGVASTIKVIDKNDPLFVGLGDSFEVGRYHSWVVNRDSLPNELQITSVVESDDIMSLRHSEYKVYGVQFHPESILTENGKTIIANFLKIS